MTELVVSQDERLLFIRCPQENSIMIEMEVKEREERRKRN